MLKTEAGRATTAIREEGERAVAAVRKAVASKPAARKKAGRETTDLQP